MDTTKLTREEALRRWNASGITVVGVFLPHSTISIKRSATSPLNTGIVLIAIAIILSPII